MKLPINKLKKVSGDKDHSIFQHEDGHEIKVAHAPLSPKVRSQLAALPHFDGGGYLEDKDQYKQADNIHDFHQNTPTPDPAPTSDTPKSKGDTGYHNQSAVDFNKSRGLAHGGSVESRAKHNSELKGINVGTIASDGRESHAGAIIRNGGDSSIPKMKASQVHSEMKSMPKPKLMAEGGRCESCPCPKCKPTMMAEGGEPVVPQTSEEITSAEDHGQPSTDLPFQPSEGMQMEGQAPAQAMDPASPAPASDTPAQMPSANDYLQAQGSVPHDSNNMPEYDDATRTGTGESNNYEGIKNAYQQDHLKEDAAFDHDLSNGHITPETYGSLFAKKDTLGKVGTIFGLLMSGFGSGLSGQPNALLHMMDQTIANDLEAQKTSKANAQNFLKINQQQALNNASIKYQGQQGKLTEAQTKMANIEAEAKTRMMMNRAALHKLVTQTNSLPDGPQKQAAQQNLAMLSQQVNNENYNIADRMASMGALAQTLGSTGNSGEQKFQQDNKILRMSGNDKMAEDREQKHFPGVTGQASAPLAGNEKEYLNSGITFHKQLRDFMDWTKKHSGDLNPADKREGEARAAELQGAYRQATHGGVYKEGEQNFIGKLINDEPTKFFNKIRVLPQLKAIDDTTHKRMDQYSKNLGFQGYSGPGGSSPQQPQGQQPQYKTVNGVKYMKGPDGKAVKVQ